MTTTPTSPPGFRDGIEALEHAWYSLNSLRAAFGDPLTRRALGGHNEGQQAAYIGASQTMAEIDAVLKALKSIPTPDTLPTGWNSDMGEAPRDGTAFLAAQRDTINVVFFDDRNPDHCWAMVDGDNYHRDWPTHWMHLPLPPPPPGE